MNELWFSYLVRIFSNRDEISGYVVESYGNCKCILLSEISIIVMLRLEFLVIWREE